MLVDLQSHKITGKDAEKVLGEANITVNKNTVPNDPESPFVTSGIRLGTAAVTTRGFKENEIMTLTNWMSDIILDLSNKNKVEKIKKEVSDLCKQFPVYK